MAARKYETRTFQYRGFGSPYYLSTVASVEDPGPEGGILLTDQTTPLRTDALRNQPVLAFTFPESVTLYGFTAFGAED